MTLSEQTTRDLLRAISDVPLTFTFDEVDYVDGATRGGLATTQQLLTGGFMGQPDLTITTCRKKLNGAGDLVERFEDDPPDVGDVITIEDADYRIASRLFDEFGMGIQYDLVSPHLGSEGAR